MNSSEKILLNHYRELYRKEKPSWAFPIAPAIPFVGNNMEARTVKVLVYASVENLTYAFNKDAKTNELLPKPEERINNLGKDQFIRSRKFYEQKKKKKKFPYVHIQPINDGSLLTVARFILKKLKYDKDFSYEPKTFIEQIAVANFGKFAIKPNPDENKNTNKDYADNYNYLKESINYIIKDLNIIKPDILVIPESIFNTVDEKREWKGIKEDADLKNEIKVVKIYQTNITVINRHIKKQIRNIKLEENIHNFPTTWPINKIEVAGMNDYLNWLSHNWQKLTNTTI